MLNNQKENEIIVGNKKIRIKIKLRISTKISKTKQRSKAKYNKVKEKKLLKSNNIKQYTQEASNKENIMDVGS